WPRHPACGPRRSTPRSRTGTCRPLSPPSRPSSAGTLGHASCAIPAGTICAVAAATREERVQARERNPKWKLPALRIEMAECINCDTCIRHCPDQFGAIFNHGIDVIIVPELCSGCGKCVPVCPVDCIYEDPSPALTPEDWWTEPNSPEDPYD